MDRFNNVFDMLQVVESNLTTQSENLRNLRTALVEVVEEEPSGYTDEQVAEAVREAVDTALDDFGYQVASTIGSAVEDLVREVLRDEAYGVPEAAADDVLYRLA